jgi:ABC-2 type transport system permease protein
MTQLRNVVDQQLRDAPVRSLAVLALLILIWAAMYFMLTAILRHVKTWGLVGIVADQHIFIHFFLVLAIMLSFSNAVLAFGSLFGRSEAGYLLSMPVGGRQVVCLKWLENMLLSSWSFLLLGVPLMLAAAANTTVAWYYYPLFLAHFVGFITVPACIGLLAAYAVAMWAPRRPLAIAVGAVLALLVLAVAVLWNISRQALESEQWLAAIFRQLSIAKQWWLPSTWTARGVVAALTGDVSDSLWNLFYVVGNGAFVAWLTINVLAHGWDEAYNRAQLGRYQPTIRSGWLTTALCWGLFFYLPPRPRQIMLKDLRSFARDAKQWTQMLIMFGLLVVYVLNLTRLPLDLSDPNIRGLIAFLNLTTVSLILATFTSRFVYPLLSLETQQLWVLELLPTRRVTLLLVKFLFALTVTTLSACGVMALAVSVLQLPATWARIHLATCLAVCVGLSGLAIGLGARFPMIGHRNPARIASGFGGTFNLIASMLFVFIEMAGIAFLTVRELHRNGQLTEQLSPETWQMLLGLVLLGLVAAGGSLAAGAQHFRRLET